jgi:uncharacterized membrane protein YjjP (DUF1212 family)/uncharacterized membrane protein YjjB (DUF3815 family)
VETDLESAAGRYSASEDDSTGSPAEPPELLPFVAQLGRSLVATGDSIASITATLYRIARAYGIEAAELVVLPSTVVVSFPNRRPLVVDLHGSNRTLRLDQIAEVARLTAEAERATVLPAEGLRRLEAIWEEQPRFRALTAAAGHMLLAAGVGLLLQPTPTMVWGCLVLGALVGILKASARSRDTLEILLPVASSFAVSVLVLLAIRLGYPGNPLLLSIPSLVTFLGGGILTIAAAELAAGQIVAGSSRLVYGALGIVLLLFGIIAAVAMVGAPPAEAFVLPPVDPFGRWAPAVGILLIGVGHYFHLSAPRGSLLWIWLVLGVAWIGQWLGGHLTGANLGGFVGGLLVTPVAYLVQYRFRGPPALVTFLPAFWLLTPGPLGVISLSELVSPNPALGIETMLTMVFTIVSIALGILTGAALVQTILRALGRSLPNSSHVTDPEGRDRP